MGKFIVQVGNNGTKTTLLGFLVLSIEAYSEPCQASEMEFYAKVVNGFLRCLAGC